MKVAIVIEMLTKLGGAERVVKELLDIFPKADLYTLVYDEKECGSVFPKEKIQTSSLQKWINLGIPKQFLLSYFPRAIEQFNLDGYDLVISSSSGFAHGVITKSNTIHISYIHAPMRYAWDYTHTYTKQKLQGWKKILQIPLFSTLKKLRIWDYTAANRSDILLSNSKTTQQRIQKYWRKDSTIIYPPVNIEAFSVQKKHNDSYFIVSALEGFKRLDIAIQAFKHMPEKKLVIAGSGSEKKRLESLAQGAKNIEFVGKISDLQVQKYMQDMKAYIFPGLEDFGITPVEAMACGKPVIFYNAGGVSESVIDGQTGVGFSTQSPESLRKAIEEFEQKQHQFDAQTIRARAEKFGKSRFSQKIMNVIEQYKCSIFM